MPSLDYPCLDGERRIFIPGKRGFFSETWPPLGGLFRYSHSLFVLLDRDMDVYQTYCEGDYGGYFLFDPEQHIPLFLDAYFDPGP